MRMIATAVALLIAVRAESQGTTNKTDWIESAEAYFATTAERTEWVQLGNEAERKQFIDRYWLRRDPTPGTPRNEFRDTIMNRILKADAKYQIEKTRGSETARGFVYVVFGPPARFRNDTAPPPQAPRSPVAFQPYVPNGTVEVGESSETWMYDNVRTPRLLEMVGLPSITFEFVIRPQKHIDELQSPGLASELRDKLAMRSLVNAGVDVSAKARAASIAPAHLGATVPDAIGQALDAAGPPSFGSPAGYFGESTRWSPAGDAVVTVWFAATRQSPVSERGGRLIGRILRFDGSVAAAFAEPLRRTEALRSSAGGPVYAVELTLPPGDYTGAFAVADAAGASLAEASLPIQVSDRAKPLAVSSIVLAPTPQRAAGGAFDIGALGLVPRADQVFSRSESLWYAGEVAHPSDPKAVAVEVLLRSGAKALGATRIALEPEPVAAGRYVFAREMPLAGLEPGDYSLYVTVRDAGGASQVRRADFRIVP